MFLKLLSPLIMFSVISSSPSVLVEPDIFEANFNKNGESKNLSHFGAMFLSIFTLSRKNIEMAPKKTSFSKPGSFNDLSGGRYNGTAFAEMPGTFLIALR